MNRFSNIQNINFLQETKDECDMYILLSEGVARTRETQKIYGDEELPKLEVPGREDNLNVIVSEKTSFEAASSYGEKKICVVNLGDAMNQGGGAVKGFTDQESSLCRASTLYRSLACKDMWQQYYLPHKYASNPNGSDDLIYSPDIIVFKAEEDPSVLLPDENWFTVDVLTASMPCCEKDQENSLPSDDLESVLRYRLSKILWVAHMNGAQVLIMPAPNKKNRVDSSVFGNALKSVVYEYGGWFNTIEIALSPEFNAKKTIENIRTIISEPWRDYELRKNYETCRYYFEMGENSSEFQSFWAHFDFDVPKLIEYAQLLESEDAGRKPQKKKAESAWLLAMLSESGTANSGFMEYQELAAHADLLIREAYADWYALFPKKLCEAGKYFQSIGELKKAVRYFEKGASLNYDGRQSLFPFIHVADCIYELGKCYAEGLGVKKNYAKAMEYYREATGDENAWIRMIDREYRGETFPAMGDLYLRGLGVEQSYLKACQCFFPDRKGPEYFSEIFSYNDKASLPYRYGRVRKLFIDYPRKEQLELILREVNEEATNEEMKIYLELAKKYLDNRG